MWLQNHSCDGSAKDKRVPLFVMDGSFNEISAGIQKDDDCTANVVCRNPPMRISTNLRFPAF